MSADETYVEARMNLDGAMEYFFNAARCVGMSSDEIANDVCDSLFNGSDGEIKAEVTINA